MEQRTVYLEADPITAYLITRDRVIPDATGPDLLTVRARRSAMRDGVGVQLTLDPAHLVDTGTGVYAVQAAHVTPETIGRAYQPWHVDVEPDRHHRWRAYLDPTYNATLLSCLHATTPGELEKREAPRVEARLAQLMEHPVEATYNLAHLQGIHRQLFQDVYPWAGEPRTVNMGKGQVPFAPWDALEETFDRLAAHLDDRDRLQGLGHEQFADQIARVYTTVNSAHPFREGNGRTQREWLSSLAAHAGWAIDWHRIHGPANDFASRIAREGDLEPLTQLMGSIVRPITDPPDPAPAAVVEPVPAPPAQTPAPRRHLQAVPDPPAEEPPPAVDSLARLRQLREQIRAANTPTSPGAAYRHDHPSTRPPGPAI